MFTNRPSTKVYQIFVREITSNNSEPLQAYATSTEDFKAFIKGKEDVDLKEKLPKEYYNLADAFSKKIAEEMLLRRDGVDYEIYLKLDS